MPLREMQRTSSPSQRHSRRTPSYLSSNTQPSSPGALSTSVASCGLMRRGQRLAARALRFGAARLRRAAALGFRHRSRRLQLARSHHAARLVRLAGIDDVRIGARRAPRSRRTLHEQPLRLLALHARAHQVPAAVTASCRTTRIRDGLSSAPSRRRRRGSQVPLSQMSTWPPPYWPFGNVALELGVCDGVVFDFDRQALVRRIERGPFGHRPTAQRAFPLEAEIPVQPPRRVLLHDEDELLAARGARLVDWARRSS